MSAAVDRWVARYLRERARAVVHESEVVGLLAAAAALESSAGPPPGEHVDGAGFAPGEHEARVAERLQLSPEQAGHLVSELRNALVPALVTAGIVSEQWSAAGLYELAGDRLERVVVGVERALALASAVAERAHREEVTGT